MFLQESSEFFKYVKHVELCTETNMINNKKRCGKIIKRFVAHLYPSYIFIER